ncbi:MAG: efflux transporter periplasmic adaptor subunit [Hyphomicrobiales bacterium]|nr:efflux transporter periplasmic adaptor subunit [Hyphomicrobiales bacterium]
MIRNWKIGLAAAAVIVVAVGGVVIYRSTGACAAGGPAGGPGMMAMPVPVIKVAKKTIPIYLEYAARTESIRNIALQAKASGYIQKQHVADGADVKKGDLIYTIDPRDYQAALDQVKAQLQRDTAALEYAKANLDRGSSLAKSGYLAQDTFDQRTSALRQAEAAIAMDEATVRTAEINLSYTEIRAPFDGRLGRNQAPIGTLVNVGGTPLNTLVQLSPIYVSFNPSETDLTEIQAARAAGNIVADVFLHGEKDSHHKGMLTFLDNAVDRATGTIVARATIENADLSLLPGQFVRIRLAVREQPNALLIPQTALGSNQLGKYVYVVGEGNKADLRLVSLGPTEGNLVTILKGVSEGDQIINGNLQKIGPGAPVHPLP